MKYYIKITTDCKIKVIKIEKRLSLRDMQNLVGGFIESVPMQGNAISMYVDEEGVVAGKPLNMAATKIIRAWQAAKGIPPEWRVSAIVGDAIVCSAAFGGMSVNNLNKVLALVGKSYEETDDNEDNA